MSLSYENDIKPLFRDSDVEAMMSWFDLSEYEGVKANAESIHERVADGSMPCDEPLGCLAVRRGGRGVSRIPCCWEHMHGAG